MSIFRWGKFTGAGGGELDFKIECDALTPEDWFCIAEAVGPKLPPFSAAFAVPTGGTPFYNRLTKFAVIDAPTVLFVDDVWTTGRSMTDFAEEIMQRDPLRYKNWIGVVAFSRSPILPPHITAFARLWF